MDELSRKSSKILIKNRASLMNSFNKSKSFAKVLEPKLGQGNKKSSILNKIADKSIEERLKIKLKTQNSF